MKFYTTVFLAPTPPEELEAAFTAAMAPYDYNETGDGEWDRWALPDWHGFTLRTGHERSPRALHGADPEGDPLVLAAPLELLDLTAMTGDTRAHAEGAWDAWAEERETFAARAAAQSMATRAYVTRDGKWWSEDDDGRGWEAHAAAMAHLLVTEPPDTMVARLYCHI